MLLHACFQAQERETPYYACPTLRPVSSNVAFRPNDNGKRDGPIDCVCSVKARSFSLGRSAISTSIAPDAASLCI